MTSSLERQEQLFHAALERPTVERKAFLRQACAEDAALCERVLALLRVHDEQQMPASAGAFEQYLARGPLGLRVGQYQVMREIGRGGFGIVFLAQDDSRATQVALKVPRLELLFSSDARRRFLAEANTVAALEHPNIARVLSAGEADGVCYMASEFCPGPSLDRWLLENRLTSPQAAKLIEQLATALQYVHEKGVLHRDLKPSNVLLWPDVAAAENAHSLAFRPLLTDFGLAKFVENSLEETASSVLMGTPLYMAPEQAECRRDEQGPWTDVYGLGAILYHLLVGTPPFAGGGLLSVLHRVRNDELVPPRRLRTDVPTPLDSICRKCLSKEPRDRYQTAGELADDLSRYLRGEKVRARPPSLWRRFQLWRQQPERMRDAGLWTMVLNLGMTLWMAGNIVAVRVVPGWDTEVLLQQSAVSLVLVIVFHLPQIGLGWLMIRRWGWAILVNVLVSAFLLLAAIGPFFSSAPPVFTGMYPTRLSLWNVHWFLAILFTSQTALSIFAYLAYRRWRKNG